MNRASTESFIAMNATVSVTCYGSQAQVSESIKSSITALDFNTLSRTFPSSQIYKLNSQEASTVSDELAALLTEIKKAEVRSGKAFCADLGRVTELWAIGTENAAVPDADDLKNAIASAGTWEIDGNKVSLANGSILDLGAVGKGIACDYAQAQLKNSKCKKAVVSVGGSLLLYSAKDNEEFKIGIRNPDGDVNSYAVTLDLNGGFVSTSGNYERYFEQDGVRYHHIFNSENGYPAESGLKSVTVCAESGLVSDALSTACFVLGYENSLSLLESYGAQAVFITAENKVIPTAGLADKIEITNKDFSL